METDVAAVPRVGLGIVKVLVQRELQDRKNALEAARGWIPRKKWEQDNRVYLDLEHWLRVAEDN